MSHRPPTPPPPGFETLAAEAKANLKERTHNAAMLEMAELLRSAKANGYNTVYLAHTRFNAIRSALALRTERQGNTRLFSYCSVTFIQQPVSNIR